MGILSAVSANNLVFRSVVAYSYNSPVPLIEIIYNLPDKRLELKRECDSVHLGARR